ncbi:MAG: DUF962 domain-containing protein [Betaproteobacteria bacterium]|nr:DUF962 domain-containing protein [Betaproteobacteria bacterium]
MRVDQLSFCSHHKGVDRSPRATHTKEPTMNFEDFYQHVFLPEHTHPINVALHMLGTFAGLGYIIAVLTLPVLWWPALLVFPVVHAVPGLIGHRWLERNVAVGDARWRRTDFPGWWFIVANHRMTAERLRNAVKAAVQ